MCFFFQIPGELGGSGLDPGGISVQSAERPPPAAGGMAGGFMVGARHVTSWPRPQVPYNKYFQTRFRIRIHLLRVWIQHFRLNTDPDPGFL
jgi:hypothetical protein